MLAVNPVNGLPVVLLVPAPGSVRPARDARALPTLPSAAGDDDAGDDAVADDAGEGDAPGRNQGCSRARASRKRGAGAPRRCLSPLVISVGLAEASAIAAELSGIELERPTTHQLMATLLDAAGVMVEWVELYDAGDGHFNARIHLRLRSGKSACRDGRPSDALALALHAGAEIRVLARALDAAARPAWMKTLAEEILADPGRGASQTACLHAGASWQADVSMSRAISHAGGFVEGDLADVGDEAFGKWKM